MNATSGCLSPMDIGRVHSLASLELWRSGQAKTNRRLIKKLLQLLTLRPKEKEPLLKKSK